MFFVSKGILNLRLNTFPLRQRIVHLLAVRPYKARELRVRMNRDGVTYKHRKYVTRTLRSVSTAKDKTYVLKDGLWNEVYEDWPFYTNVEQQQFSRRKKKNLTPPEPDCGNSVSSIGYDHS